jgi:hypothetical protein
MAASPTEVCPMDSAAVVATELPAIFSWGAAALEAVHSTGLPWWATIPLTSIALKGMLMPLSIKNAKV